MPYPGCPVFQPMPQFRGDASNRPTQAQRAAIALVEFVTISTRLGRYLRRQALLTGNVVLEADGDAEVRSPSLSCVATLLVLTCASGNRVRAVQNGCSTNHRSPSAGHRRRWRPRLPEDQVETGRSGASAHLPLYAELGIVLDGGSCSTVARLGFEGSTTAARAGQVPSSVKAWRPQDFCRSVPSISGEIVDVMGQS